MISAGVATIIAGIIGLAGSVTGAAIGARSARRAGEMQIKATEKANRQSREDWREVMEIEEEERKKNALRDSMTRFQNTINSSEYLKKQVSSLWAGTGV